jgi:hypothetical protein
LTFSRAEEEEVVVEVVVEEVEEVEEGDFICKDGIGTISDKSLVRID